jgi:hypothetical protein
MVTMKQIAPAGFLSVYHNLPEKIVSKSLEGRPKPKEGGQGQHYYHRASSKKPLLA